MSMLRYKIDDKEWAASSAVHQAGGLRGGQGTWLREADRAAARRYLGTSQPPAQARGYGIKYKNLRVSMHDTYMRRDFVFYFR